MPPTVRSVLPCSRDLLRNITEDGLNVQPMDYEMLAGRPSGLSCDG